MNDGVQAVVWGASKSPQAGVARAPFVSLPAGSGWGSTKSGVNEGNSIVSPVDFRPYLWGILRVEVQDSISFECHNSCFLRVALSSHSSATC